MADAPIPYARPVGPALVTAKDAPPCAIPRALAVWLVLRLAQMLAGGYECGVNDGPLVRLFHRVTGVDAGAAWCASFTAFCRLLLGALVLEIPATASCAQLGEWGKKRGLIDRKPEVGDLLLFWHFVASERRWRFAHVGFVLHVHADGTLDTLEGNTNDDGSREGWRICKKVRRLEPNDVVLHWHHLLPE